MLDPRSNPLVKSNWAAILDSLGSWQRRLIIALISQPMCASDIAKHLDIPPTTLNYYLRELKASGAVRCYRDGRYMMYIANKPKILSSLEEAFYCFN